ncbi:hypothetical protein M8818_005133 [Zalaria obscura]|uniref:Uncharacterized protein n=1 Tax=Zalaria obscura TaxID=2024903 RepID=A0ACC3S9U2_9PEZI
MNSSDAIDLLSTENFPRMLDAKALNDLDRMSRRGRQLAFAISAVLSSASTSDSRVTSLCEAARRGDEETVREQSFRLENLPTSRPKEEANVAGRPDLLRLLLARDDAIEEHLVAATCERRDRKSVRMLLVPSWPINRSVYSAASLLWSV